MSKLFMVIGSLFGFLAVAAGAFGAHTLRESLSPEAVSILQTGVRYQMYHAFALLVAGWALDKYERREFVKSGWAFVAGIALFSGSLYILGLTGARWVGLITPAGGVAFLTGWLYLARGFWRLR
ncbi:MAG: membrane protein [Bacteroidia bacterium]|nr:MAG: membrane protein [Bacteroidia bacterium]